MPSLRRVALGSTRDLCVLRVAEKKYKNLTAETRSSQRLERITV
jgi:hypothetical protein